MATKKPAEPKTGAGDLAATATQDPPPTTEGTTTTVANPDLTMASGAPAPGDPPDLAKVAASVGLDPDDLDDDDKAELLAAARADAVRQAGRPDAGDAIVSEIAGNNSPRAISLLLEACEKFGVDARADARPRQLLAWRYYQGADDPGRVAPDAVVFTTAGGVKLKHWDDPDEPMDLDTLDRLRRIFGCFRIDPNSKQETIDPLPKDLRLPANYVTGIGTGSDHVYQGGYLKAGGRDAADAKAKRRAEREKRLTK